MPKTDILPVEKVKITKFQLDLLEMHHETWWIESHGENPKAYAKAKDKIFGLTLLCLPALIKCYRKYGLQKPLK
jgi:hypothetical protein